MKILVYGAGNLGSLDAAKLKDGGHDVSILARGARLHEIREHGILPQDFHSGQESTTRIEAVEGDELLDPIWRAVQNLVLRTRAWDSRVKGRWKLRYYEHHYRTFEQFCDQAKSEWSREFFEWVDRCCSERMGLFLDY